MDQVEVDVAETEALERLLERLGGLGLTPGALDPELRGDEHVLPAVSSWR